MKESTKNKATRNERHERLVVGQKYHGESLRYDFIKVLVKEPKPPILI